MKRLFDTEFVGYIICLIGAIALVAILFISGKIGG